MPKKLTLSEMHTLAQRRGGNCLSKKYVNNATHLDWQCANGHQWSAKPANIKLGQWCPHCRRTTIEYMQELAKNKGGLCLSTTYVNSITYMWWQCKEGHQWQAQPMNIKDGHWCPYCANRAPLTMEDMHNLAKKRGGRCLSKIYVNAFIKLLWQCKQGHQWWARPNNIRSGKWCPHCAGITKLTIQEMHKMAAAKNGKCLSNKYVNNNTPLLWQCKQGHQWWTQPHNIRSGKWCPYCAGQIITIEDMHKLATAKGGKCLSDKYVNSKTPLLWQCKQGHQWQTRPDNITSGTWCPHCGGTKKLTIEDMHKLAAARGGKCLSDKYVNIKTQLLWQCAKRHIWEATPDLIKSGSWCPVCRPRKHWKKAMLKKLRTVVSDKSPCQDYTN